MKLTVTQNELMAARMFASADETRPDINSVHLESDGKRTLLVATDGRRMVAIKSDRAPEESGSVTIRTDQIDLLHMDSGSNAVVEAETDGNTVTISRWAEGAHRDCIYVGGGKPIGGYPNWRRIFPTFTPQTSACISINPAYLDSFAAALTMLAGGMEVGMVMVPHGDTEAIVILSPQVPRFAGLLMPIRLGAEKMGYPEWMGL